MKRISAPEKLIRPILSSIAVGAILAMPVVANAVKAKPGIIEYTEPDGTTVDIRLYGDERANFAANTDGYVVMRNDQGFLEYAVMNAYGQPTLSGKRVSQGVVTFDSGVRLISAQEYVTVMQKEATKTTRGSMKGATRASAGDNKYVYSSCAFPTKGEPHSIVVLVEYTDVKFSMDNPWEYYNDYLNGDNFTNHGGTGSCKQYFNDSSLGLFSPTYDLYGPVPLKYNQKYYGGNGRYGDGGDVNATDMIVEAVKYLDSEVDFSQYDHNGDGYVDSIYIIYAGQGEADSYIADTVWPHSWELSEAGVGAIPVDGVKVDAYGCSQELSGRTPTGIGVFVHEFGHVMGLPDLYNTNNPYDESTPLDWSLMDQGSYNNDTRTPPAFSAFERYSLGWIEPEEIYVAGDYQMGKLTDQGRAFILTTEENPDEFFMLENRQQEGWDTYLPYHGMLIWHISFSQKNWDYNTPNNNSSRQGIGLVRADNVANMSSYRGDPFPGIGMYTEFSTTTTPRLQSYDKKPLNVTRIGNITESNGMISFQAEVTEDRSDKLPAGIIDATDVSVEIWSRDGMLYTSGDTMPVYDISGRKVGNVSSGLPLEISKGIYIVSGKKIFVK